MHKIFAADFRMHSGSLRPQAGKLDGFFFIKRAPVHNAYFQFHEMKVYRGKQGLNSRVVSGDGDNVLLLRFLVKRRNYEIVGGGGGGRGN
jgi:hypothetical protein